MIELVVLGLSTFANLALGLLIYSKNPSSLTNRLFALLAASLVAWPPINYLSIHSSSHQLLYVRLVLMFVVLMNLAFYLMAATFPRHDAKLTKLQRGAVWYALGVALFTLTPAVFSGATILPDGKPSPIPAPGMAFFVLDILLYVGGGLFLLLKRMRREKGHKKAQLQFIFFGGLIMYGMAVLTNFVLAVALQMPGAVAFGPLWTVVFAGMVAYAIVRHRMFDIRKVAARGLSYTLLVAALASMYAVVAFNFSAAFTSGSHAPQSQVIVNAALAIVLAFTFQPLRRFFEHLTDKIFFRDHYDSQEFLNQVGQTLVAEFKLERLLARTLATIGDNLKVGIGQFYVFENERIYKFSHYGAIPSKLMTVPRLVQFRHRITIADELDEGTLKSMMDEFGIRAVIRLRTKKEFVGYLLLGEKLSGSIYTPQDVELLEILSQELAVAISNAKAYEEIAHFNATLQGKVDDATKRLRAANQNLQQLDVAKDEFISMASHQLRTPLTSIKGYLSMLLEGDAGPVSATQQEFLEFAYGGSQRMVNLISDLLNVSRMSAGKFFIEKAPVDLIKVVTEETRQLQQHAEAKHLKLTFLPPEQALPLIELDENKTRQVIMNFIDNAIYYTKEGGVTVTLERVGGCAELKVCDTGIGVPKVAKAKLFTKFYRADNAQSVRPDGTGLGLFLAKRVIEDQGGTILFTTTEGKGSTFGFSMPLTKEAHDTHQRPPRKRTGAASAAG